MKTYNQTKRLLLLCMVAFLSLSSWAIWYDGKQTIIFKSHPANALWWGDGTDADKYAFFTISGSTSGEWAKATYFHGPSGEELFCVTVPQGDWTHMVLTRNKKDAAPGFDANLYNQTADIPLEFGKDYLTNFAKTGDSFDYTVAGVWSNLLADNVNPNTLASNDGITIEEWHLCTDAAGDPLTLQPSIQNLNATGTDRNWDLYTNSQYAWMKYTDEYPNGQWQLLTASDKYYDKETITAGAMTFGGGTAYYYLYDKVNPSVGRMIKVMVDQDCTPTCDITRLEYVVSSVDANRETFVIDGIVAFEATNGNLVLTCEPASGAVAGTVYPSASYPSIEVVSPHIFKLDGIPADGKQYTLTAYFEGNPSCRKSITFSAPTPKDRLQVIHDTVFTTQSITLEPVSVPTESHGWLHYTDDSSDNLTDRSSTDATDDWKLIVPAPGTAANDGDKLAYIYHEYNPVASPDNLFDNGSFENVTGLGNDKKCSDIPISQYVYWGYDIESYYSDTCEFTDGTKGTTGGFTLTRDANLFWHNYSKLYAHDGSNFALIDGKPNDAGAEAWYADTEHNPNLKLKVNTTYLFSFWVANVNNYGEKDNPAILQFRIIYNDGVSVTTKDLGDPINLADYDDKNWHQCTALFEYPSKTDANEVKIIVVDQNGRKLVNGNDFALDDIQFRPVTTYTRTLKIYQERMVHYLKSEMHTPTVSIPAINCGATQYSMTITTECLHPNGNLVIIDKADVPISATFVPDYNTITRLATISFTEAEVKQNTAVRKSVTITRPYTSDNAEHTLVAFFTNYAPGSSQMAEVATLINESDVVKELTYNEPALPTVADLQMVRTMLSSCSEPTEQYTVSLQVTPQNQRGELKVYDTVDGTKTLKATVAESTYMATLSPTAVIPFAIPSFTILADGKTHEFSVEFSETACESNKVRFVATPAPKVVAVNQTPTFDIDCIYYTDKLQITYTNAQDYVLIVEDEEGTKVYEGSVESKPEGLSVETIRSFDNTNHRYTAYFEGRKDCSSATSAGYLARTVPTISVTDIEAVPVTTCNATTFNVAANVSITDARGSMVLAYRDEHDELVNLLAIPEGMYPTSGSITIPNVPVAMAGTRIQVYFVDPAELTTTTVVNPEAVRLRECTIAQANYFNIPTPVAPSFEPLSISNVQVSAPDCNTTTFTVSLQNLVFAEQSGNMLVYIDGVEKGRFSESDYNMVTAVPDLTTQPISADGKAHTLKVLFSGTSCEQSIEIPATSVPNGQVIKSVDYEILGDLNCGQEEFDVKTTVSFENGYGDLRVVINGTGEDKLVPNVQDSADNRISVIFHDINISQLPSADNLTVYFMDRNSCIQYRTIEMPELPSVSHLGFVINNTPVLSCVSGTFQSAVSLQVEIHNQRGELKVYDTVRDYNSGSEIIKTEVAHLLEGEYTDGVIKLPVFNVQTDANTQHHFTVEFAETGCESNTARFYTTLPRIVGTHISKLVKCEEDNELEFLEIRFLAGGHTFTIRDEKGNIVSNFGDDALQTGIEVPAGTVYNHEVMVMRNLDNTNHYYTISIDGFEDCVSATTDAVFAYKWPKVDVSAVNSLPVAVCDAATFDLTIDISVTDARGALMFAYYDEGHNLVTLKQFAEGTYPTSGQVTIQNIPMSMVGTNVVAYYDIPEDSEFVMAKNIRECSLEKNVNFDIPAPTAPTLNDLTTADISVPTSIACGETEFTVQVTPVFANQYGNAEVLDNGQTHIFTDYTLPFEYQAVADGLAHNVLVRFPETGCETALLTGAYTAPAAKQNITNAIGTASTPDASGSYVLSIAVQYENANAGDELVIVLHDNNNPSKPDETITNTVDGSGSFTYTDTRLAQAEQYSYRVYFTNSPDCYKEGQFDVNDGQILAGISETLSDIECEDENYTTTVKVDYINGYKNIIVRETVSGEEHTLAVVAGNGSVEQQFTFPIDGLERKFEAWTEGQTEKLTLNGEVAIAKPRVTALELVSSEEVACGGTTYSVTVKATSVNGRGNLVLHPDFGSDVLLAEGHYADEMVFTIPADGTDHTIEAWFADAVECEHQTLVLTKKESKSAITLAQNSLALVSCESDQFHFEGKLTITNPKGDIQVFDENDNVVWEAVEGEYDANATTLDVVIEGLADGKEHKYHALFAGQSSCVSDGIVFTPQVASVVLDAQISVVAVNKDEVNALYDLQVTVPVQNISDGGDVLHIERVDGAGNVLSEVKVNVLPSDNNATGIISGIAANGDNVRIHLFLESRPACDYNKVFSPDDDRQITTVVATPTSPDCDETDYSSEVVVTYTGGYGDLYVRELTTGETMHQAAKNANGSLTFNFTALPLGEQHQYEAWFEGNANTQKSATELVLPEPKVLNHLIVSMPNALDCDATQYDIQASVTTANPQGRLVITDENGTEVHSAVMTASDLTYTYEITLPADGQAHQLFAQFENGKCPAVEAVIPALSAVVIGQPTVLATEVSTVDATYDLTLSVPYQNANVGEKLHTVRTQNGQDLYEVRVADIVGDGVFTETITDIVATGEKLEFRIYAESRPECEKTVEQQQTDAQILNSAVATHSQVGCGDNTYDVQIEVVYTNGYGVLVAEDANDATVHAEQVIVAGTTSTAFTFSNLLIDGQEHKFNVWFKDLPQNVLPTNSYTIAVPSISDLSVTVAQAADCGDTRYGMLMEFNISNVVAGEMLYITDGQGVVSTYIVSDAEVQAGKVSIPFSNLALDGNSYTASVQLGGCEITAGYTSPVAPSMDEPVLTPITGLACSQTEAGVSFRVSSANQQGNFTVLDASNNNRIVFGPVAAADLIKGTTEPLTAGIAHWLVFRFDGAHSCESDPIKVELPKITRIEATQLTAVASGVANSVNATTVSVDVTAVFDFNQTLADLVITADGEEALTVQNPESGKVYTITLPADGKEHTIGASLGNCEYDEVKVLVGATPTIGALTAVAEALHNDCNVHTNIVNFSVEFSGLAGDLVLADNGTEVLTIANPVSGQMYEYDMPLDGQSHTFTAKIADGETNAVQIVAPVQPTLLSFTVNAQTDAIACGETAYNATGVLTVQNIYGDYRITDEATGEEVLTGTIPQGAVTIADFNFSLAHTADNAEHSFLLTLTNTGCAIKSNSFVEPALTICNVYSDTICQTEQYAENGFNVTAPEVGMNKLVNGNDTLYLFVEAVPVAEIGIIEATCASEGSVVSVPFEITQGTPATYSIIFKDARFEPIEGKLPSNGEFAITVPEGVEGGQFEAELHLYSEYGHCESVAQTFTFNLSHDNLVYSKWNDVLFIDNHEDKFVSYQWYENGKALEGETEQRLYKPEDGMTGSYYCVMTTTDGATVQTCEYLFSDAPRSADVVAERYHKVTPTHLAPGQTLTIERSEATNADIIVYDPTGRQVSRVYTESEKTEIKVPSVVGVYMIRLTDRENGDSWTEKIIVK